MTQHLRYGKPWGAQLQIARLGERELEATYPGAGFLASACLTLIGLAVTGTSLFVLKEMSKLDTSILIASVLFLMIGIFTLVLGIGSYTYRITLRIGPGGLRYLRKFLWHKKKVEGPPNMVECVRCWQHASGSGGDRREHVSVCLHMIEPLEPVCVYTEEYAGEKSAQLPPKEEAVRNAMAKADEIAAKLGVHHDVNYEA